MRDQNLFGPVHATLPTHRKTRALARRLKRPVPLVVGGLVCLWCKAMLECPDGCLEGWSADDLADAFGFDGDPADLRAALLETHWVTERDGALYCHEWADYFGRELTRRSDATERKRKERKVVAPPEVTPCHAPSQDVTATVCDSSGQRVADPEMSQETETETETETDPPDRRPVAADPPPAASAAKPSEATQVEAFDGAVIVEPPLSRESCLASVDASWAKKRRKDHRGFPGVVLECWRDAVGKNSAVIMTKERRRAIRDALDAGYTFGDVLRAAEGIRHDDFLMGREKRSNGQAHNDLEVALRLKPNHLERLRDEWLRHEAPPATHAEAPAWSPAPVEIDMNDPLVRAGVERFRAIRRAHEAEGDP